jgi:hypothetical protein
MDITWYSRFPRNRNIKPGDLIFKRFAGSILALALLTAATIPSVSAQTPVGFDAVLNDLHDAASRGILPVTCRISQTTPCIRELIHPNVR